MKIPGLILKEFLPEILGQMTEHVPKDYVPSCKEARCVLQLYDWLRKRITELAGLDQMARAVAWRCDSELEKRKEMAEGLRDLYLLLASYGIGDPQ